MIQTIIETIKDLLPNKDLPTNAWIARTLVLFSILGISGYGIFQLLINTTLGEKYNVRLNSKLPQLTHMELLITRRQVWQQLSELRRQDDDVRAIFLMVLIDKKSRNIVQQDNVNPGLTDVVIWDFEIPVRRFSSLEIIEDVANNLQDDVEPKVRETKRCLTLPITGDTLKTLKRAIPDFLSTHVVVCPIYTFYNPRLIGATMMFFRIRPPLEAWHYEEKLRLSTIQISGFFRDFTVHYEMIYE